MTKDQTEVIHAQPAHQLRGLCAKILRVLSLAALTCSANAVTPLADDYAGCEDTIVSSTVVVGPAENYQSAVDAAVGGQRVLFQSGTYSNGLRLYDLIGSAGNCIIIEGPPDQSAVFVGLPINGVRNVVQIRNSSYLVLRNLEIDGAGTTNLDGIKSDANLVGGNPNPWSHHLVLENLYIHDFDFSQQQVGISTKGPAWNWVVRHNRIERVGTGIYFGNSNGAEHFVNGLIEYNLITDSVGYNMQIKHQFAASRPDSGAPGYESLPATGRTVIRHNVFHKGANSSGGASARPNLLVGAQPLSGDGANDSVIISQNFFYQNPTGFEALFQGEGNITLFGNLLYNGLGPGVFIQPQNGEVREVRIFQNTVVADGTGIRVSSPNGAFAQLVRGNAVFASGTALSGGTQTENIIDTLNNADQYLNNPTGLLTGADRLDLFPLNGALTGAALDLDPINTAPDFDRDFNDAPRTGGFRGAYAGEGSNPGWLLALEIKPELNPDILFANGFE